MLKVTVVTGTRAEYGIYTSILDAVDRARGIEYELLVTCMHLSPEYGNTVRYIEEDGRRIGAKVDMLISSDTGAAMAKSVGLGLIGMAQAFETMKPDVVLVLGDRGEMLAAAMAAAYMNIPVAHLHGGEVSGTIDEPIRHAITKFSHIHLPATHKSVERLVKMGEDDWRIHLVGAPGVDSIYKHKLMSRREIAKLMKFDPAKDIILAVQHPVTTETDDAVRNMEQTIDALTKLKRQTVFIHANADAGGKAMMGRMEELIKNFESLAWVRRFVSLPHKTYLSVMKNCSVMISNSSSGIIEAPSFGIPVVNVGTRQNNRERADNIQDTGCDTARILAAVDRAINDEKYRRLCRECGNPFDPFRDGRAAERVVEALLKVKRNRKLIQKTLTY